MLYADGDCGGAKNPPKITLDIGLWLISPMRETLYQIVPQ